MNDACIVGGLFAIAGALQMGPLSQYIYKTSVSLRGQYWLAGWNTGQAHPTNGVGMDAFGDWYRRTRDIRALELPGANTVVNAAHNVPLDMFAFGGWPLFLTYLAIMGLALASIVRVTMSKRTYDPIFVGLTQDYTKKERAKVSLWTAFNVFLILLVSFFVGQYVLSFFGITITALVSTKI